MKLLHAIESTHRDRIATARHLVVLTGAGMSAPSGLPTYRGPGGLYTSPVSLDPPVFTQDLDFRPTEVSQYVESVVELSQASAPHDGHHQLTETQQELTSQGGSLTLVTMNIDDLHERSGAHALHLHGRASSERCSTCTRQRIALHRTDQCECGGRFRPDIVLLGESEDQGVGRQGRVALSRADVFYVIGSSGVPKTPAVWAQTAKQECGGLTVLLTIDPDPDFAKHFDVVIDDSAENLGRYLPGGI